MPVQPNCVYSTIPPGEPSLNLLDMWREGIVTPMHSAVRQALRSRQSVEITGDTIAPPELSPAFCGDVDDVKCLSLMMSALATARVQPPQVVLLDIGLPDMSGYELARTFRENPQLASQPC